jgi:ceramide glucosyltransferase
VPTLTRRESFSKGPYDFATPSLLLCTTKRITVARCGPKSLLNPLGRPGAIFIGNWTVIGYALAFAGTVYSVLAWVAVWTARRPLRIVARQKPGVTILKPLCGVEPRTYECLRSFCDQSYPTFQIVFGVADPADPAVCVVERLQTEFPQRDLRLVVDRRQHGSSRKVSNLINMMSVASHELLVMSDSDVRVNIDYLEQLVGALLEPDVGIVTCSYRGRSNGGLWSLLGSLFINEWFFPSVRFAAMSGSRAFAFGATIAIKRRVLEDIGGFAAIVNHLADDYQLGELTRRQGLRTALSATVVEIAVVERSFRELVGHELRWLRTIRAVQPLGYTFLFVTFGLPVTVIGMLFSRGAPVVLAMLGVTSLARLLLHWRARQTDVSFMQLALIPARDCLSLGLWAWGFTTRQVRWREESYRVARDGTLLS